MGDAMLVVAFVAGTGLDPHPESDGFKIWNGFGGDSQAVRETAYLNTHMDFTPCARPLTRSSRAVADMIFQHFQVGWKYRECFVGFHQSG